MPVLTDEQHQELLDKSKKANERANESQRLLQKSEEEKEEKSQQRNVFLTTTIILFALLVAGLIIYFVQPDLLFKGQQLDSDEVVVKQQTIDEYESQIADYNNKSETNNENSIIIDGQNVSTFFAVQLGAFTKFNEPIVSPQYSLIKHIKEDGFTKYTVGVFDNAKDARNLRNKLIKLGFEDAFVGKYNNGKRLDIIE